MNRDIVRRRWYWLAALSGVLLVLSFYPFYAWPLCFVALVPVSLVAAAGMRRREVFSAGCIAVGMMTFTQSFFLVVQFNWLPASPLFTEFIRYGGVLVATVGYGALFGTSFLIWSQLRSRSIVLNAMSGAVLFVVAERIAQFSVGGYYIGTLSHAVTPLPLLMSLAAVGGASLVSFVIALVNIYAAEMLLLQPEHRRAALWGGGALAAAILLVFATNAAYLRSGHAEARPFSIATVQVASPKEKTFALLDAKGTLSFPWLQKTLAEAAQGSPDLIVYPESPVSGIVVRGAAPAKADAAWVATSEAALQSWMKSYAPQGAVMTWENVAQQGAITTQFQFWRGGTLSGEVMKRSLLPFMDYEPAWARAIGLYSMPFDVERGPAAPASVAVAGVSVGGLVCSEVHREGRARAEAAVSSVLVAAGSEAMFQDDGTSRFSLRAAQYRAVENNRPVVRASLLGPSAIIDRTGRIVAQLPLGQGGIVRGTVSAEDGPRTLFSAWGDVPLMLLMLASVGAAARLRFPCRWERG